MPGQILSILSREQAFFFRPLKGLQYEIDQFSFSPLCRCKRKWWWRVTWPLKSRKKEAKKSEITEIICALCLRLRVSWGTATSLEHKLVFKCSFFLVRSPFPLAFRLLLFLFPCFFLFELSSLSSSVVSFWFALLGSCFFFSPRFSPLAFSFPLLFSFWALLGSCFFFSPRFFRIHQRWRT